MKMCVSKNRKRVRPIYALILLRVFVADLAIAATPAMHDRHGALALGGDGFGAAQNWTDEAGAASSALAQCEANGGNGQCRIRLSYRNQCAALASGEDRFVGVAYASELAKAQKLARQSCAKSTRNCLIIYSACSYSR